MFNRFSSKGAANGDEAVFLDRIGQLAHLIAAEAGFGKTLDVAQIHPVLEGRVGVEAVEIAVLQLEAEFREREIFAEFGKFLEDTDAMIDLAHMIIRHLEHKQRRWNSAHFFAPVGPEIAAGTAPPPTIISRSRKQQAL